jgi:hypothetical protein
MMTVAEVIARIWCSAAGFACGYLVCAAMRQAVAHDRPGGDVFRTIIGVLIVALAATTTAQIYTSAACQNQVNEKVIAALIERSDAAAERDEAQRKFLLTLAAPSPQEQRQKAFNDYLASFDAAAQRRASNPLNLKAECGILP